MLKYNFICVTGLEVFVAVLQMVQVFWDVMMCHCVSSSSYFVGLQCFYLQAIQEEALFVDCLTLQMKALDPFKHQELFTLQQSVT
jgi:hypothetical protein